MRRGQLHLAEDAFALQLLFQSAQGLVNVLVADDDLHTTGFRVLKRWTNVARFMACPPVSQSAITPSEFASPGAKRTGEIWEDGGKTDWLLCDDEMAFLPFVNPCLNGPCSRLGSDYPRLKAMRLLHAA
jgi:hypothetical protein